MKKATILYLLLALAGSASAADYYVDPVKGSMGNAGTAELPWSTLSAVFAASPAKVFLPGDHIYLRRGNHGTVVVTGINTNGDVYIEAEAGHTPVVRMSMLNAHHWRIRGLTILGGVVIDNQNNENSDYNTFENCYMPSGGFQVYGNYNTLRGNHIRSGGILFGFHSNNGLVSGNTLEDFYSDGMHNQGNYGVWENNLVMNSHKINGNHNDLFQSLASVGNVLRGNEFRAYSDPNQADLIAPGVSDVQGIGLFDGWYTDWVIENNVVLVDHPIGIWILGAQNCRIKNNTVLRCGQYSLFPYLYSPERFPNIRVAAKKSGAASTGNLVMNNAAERFELDPVDNAGVSMGIATCNVVVAKSAFGSTFLNWAKKDLHLKSGAAAVIDAGTASNSPPVIDADGNARPTGAAWDCGAFEYGYVTSADTTAPSKPTGLTGAIITGYGVDLRWTASTDNRKVLGYDVFRNGVMVGRTRAGTNYLDINTNTTASYTVQAFDHADNKSVMSDPISGTPPDPDTQAPTTPSNVVATVLSSRSIQVTWQASLDNWGVAGYQVFRDGALVTTVTTTNYVDTGLAVSTLYSYAIVAYDAAANASGTSTPVSATTLAPDVTPPAAPLNVVAMALSTHWIQVLWSPATDNVGVTAYDVFRDGTNVNTVAGTNYVDTGLLPSTAYSYTVRATDAETNRSEFSIAAVATTFDPDTNAPSVPASLTATAMSSGSILLQWPASTDNRGVVWYNIYRDGAVVDSVLTTNTLDVGLSASTLYRYNVTAVDEAGNESATSAVASATTLEPLPLLVGESFEYAAGTNLNGLNGGTGWGGAWVVGYNSSFPATVEAGAFSYPGVGASGNLMKFWTAGNGNIYENLDRGFESLLADGGQTVWFAMVVGLCNSKNAATWSFVGLTTDAAGTNAATLFTTTANGTPTPFTFGSTTLFTGDTNYTPHLVLVKMAMSGDANPETLTAYVDPNLSADPGTWTGVARTNLYANGGLIGFNYRGGRASTATPSLNVFMDEIRLGATWEAAVGQAAGATDTNAPSVPANVMAAAQSSSSVLVTWSAATDNVAVVGYTVYRNGTNVTTVSGTNYTDTGRAASTLYTYTVTAKDAAGNESAASEPAVATTLAPVTDTTAPSIPTNVTATAISSSAIALSWKASTDNVAVAGYEVYRGASKVGTPVATNFTDTGLSASTLYSYTVKAFDATGNVSAASAVASATTLAAASGSLLVEESFNYAATNLVGLNGGTGWSGGWSVESHYDTEAGAYAVLDGSLTNYPGMAVAGGRGSFLAGGGGTYYPSAQRNFASAITDDGGAYWLAFQLQAPGYHKDATFTLLGAATNSPLVKLKTDVVGMDFQFLGGAYYSTVDTNTHLFLIKIQMSGDTNAEMARLYYDPDLSADDSTWTPLRSNTFVITSVSGLTAFRADSARSGNTGYRTSIDEIRLATTWQAAVGKAAPSSDSNSNNIPDAWENAYFGSTTNSKGVADYDWDHDGLNNQQEYWAGTDPTNNLSVLELISMGMAGTTNLVLNWQSVSGRIYAIQYSTNLLNGFLNTPDANIVATGGTVSRTVNLDRVSGEFHRVVVQP